MADHRNVVVAERFADVAGRRAMEGVAAMRGKVECRAQMVFGGNKPAALEAAPAAEGRPDLDEAIPAASQ